MKYLAALIFVVIGSFIQAQQQIDTSHLSTIYLDEVIVFDKKVKVKKLGYLNKENFTFSLYEDYEIGAFIDNPEKLETIVDLHFKVENELECELDIEINFYEFSGTPEKLIRSIDAIVTPSKKNKLIISNNGNINIKFPKKGVFVSTKIKSDLTKEDSKHFRVYLSKKYKPKATFIRGSMYGGQWTELSKLNLRGNKTINVCYGINAH